MTLQIFSPTKAWAQKFYELDCPLARVTVGISGASHDCVNEAVRSLTAGIKRDDAASGETHEVFYSGGWVLHIDWQDGGYPALTLASAGEDGLDSLEYASQELAEALAQSCDGAVLTYEEVDF